MPLCRDDVVAIASQVIPSWDDDDDLRDYLLQILMEEDSYQEAESLKKMLLPFVGGSEETAAATVEQLLAKLGLNEGVEKTDQETSWRKFGQTFDPVTKENVNDISQEQGESRYCPGEYEKSKKHHRSKRQERLQKRRVKKEPNLSNRILTPQMPDDETTEDDASAWRKRQMEGKGWGGRGYGGRGEYAGK